MAKDPAFLFYYQDFLVGTDHMTLEQIGAYIRCLCHQANRGSIREPHMVAICGSIANLEIVKEKFILNGNGEFFNERLKFEVEKRKKYTNSRLLNLHMGKHMETHMENENENKDLKSITSNTNIKKERKHTNEALRKMAEWDEEEKRRDAPPKQN